MHLAALVLSIALLYDQPTSPIELAASTAACMQKLRGYENGQRIEVYGTVWSATLLEESEPFATVSPALGERGNYSLDPLTVGTPAHGEDYGRERDRAALACFGDALAAVGR